MPANAADIPPELFPIILDYVGAERYTHKRRLFACALNCVWWAQQCRQSIFLAITLRSMDDLRTCQSLISTTPPRLVPIDTLLRVLLYEQRIADRLW